MPAYATIDELSNAIGADTLLTIAGFDGSVDEDKVNAALLDASGVADGYIQASFPPGSTAVPGMVKRAVILIANFLLRTSDMQTEDTRNSYKAAIDWLTAIAKGVAVIPTDPGTPGTVDPGDPLVLSGERIFTRQSALWVF